MEFVGPLTSGIAGLNCIWFGYSKFTPEFSFLNNSHVSDGLDGDFGLINDFSDDISSRRCFCSKPRVFFCLGTLEVATVAR